MRDAFLFFRSYHECLQHLPDKNQLEIYQAIAEYSLNFREPKNLTGISRSIWVAIKPSLELSIKRAKAGRVGGKKSHSNQHIKKTLSASKPQANEKKVQANTRGKCKQTQASCKQAARYKNKNKNKNNIDKYIAEFNLLFKTSYKVTENRKRKINARIASFTFEEILQALRNLATSPFHKGENERGWRADPDFLIRSDEQVDKWLQHKPKNIDNGDRDYFTMYEKIKKQEEAQLAKKLSN